VLGQTGILAADELPYARKVLSAAALTYVAATSAALVNLLRLMLMHARDAVNRFSFMQ